MSRTPAPEHPLVAAYLADLERALVAADPREREDTLDAVREHLLEALGAKPSTADVTEVLTDLGSVDVIAASVTPAGRPPVVALAAAQETLTAPAVAGRPAGPDAGSVVALVAGAFALLLVLLVPLLAIPVALVALVVAVLRVRRTAGSGALAWSAVVLSGSALLVAALLSLSLLATGSDHDPAPGPVHSEPLDQG
ncbi:HAAS signaling domain-containing protein [Cellulomonas palmilytica]|uniref:HAAS signaling domain-containing protein n=1 Tax=Cellulomonas palmilytica TaxID=2608402 RepID=UPI001F33F4BC|nr:hypothetical protein [Cellulomonas palmilytica]UJP41099.1 hypothetical protein F1D97_06510 [Cellulomonas palmilytica]